MKRYFCLLLAFIVLLMTHSATVKAADGVTIKSITPNRYVAHVGDSITYTVAVTGDTTGDVRYDYCVYVNGQKKTSGLQVNPYGLKTSTYEVLCQSEGEYSLGCRVYKFIPGKYQPMVVHPPELISPVTKVALTPQVFSVYPDRISAKTGDSLSWTVGVSGGFLPLKYSWGIQRNGNTIKISGKTTSKTITYPLEFPGNYSADVWVSDDGGMTVYGKSAITVPVKQTLVIKNVEPNKEIAHTGEYIRWTVIGAIGGMGPMSYHYSIDVYRDGVLLKKNPWNKSIDYTMKADKPGFYSAMAYVTDGKEQAAKNSLVVTRVVDPLSIVNVFANRESAPVGAEIIWTATTEGGFDPQYRFDLWKGTQPVSSGKWSKSNTYTWTATSAGSYHVNVSVHDAFYDIGKQDSAAISVSVSSDLSVKSVHVDRTIATVGEKITWTAASMGGSGTKSYKFLVFKDGIGLPIAGIFTSSPHLGYTTTEAGKYKVIVYIKDGTATTSSPVVSAETAVLSLIPLSETLPFSSEFFASPPPSFSHILIPDDVTILMTAIPNAVIVPTQKPALRPTSTPKPLVTPTPTVEIIVPEPIKVEPTTAPPMVELFTGYIFITPAPTVGID